MYEVDEDLKQLGWVCPDGFAMPPLDSNAERKAFIVAMDKLKNIKAIKPSQEEISLAVDELERIYAPAKWTLRPDFFSEENIRRSILNSNDDSSPGFPLCVYYTTNKLLKDGFGIDNLVKAVSDRFYLLLDLHIQGKNWTFDHCDPIRLFIKNELVSREKLDQWSLRIIWAAAFVDQMIDDVLFGPGDREEIARYDAIPSKPGMDNHGGIHELVRYLGERGVPKDYVDLDKSGWDITYRDWEMEAEFEYRCRACANKDSLPFVFDAWKGVANIRLQMLMQKRIAFSDGLVLDQMVPGIMPSGSKITISANSRAQVLLKIIFSNRHGGYDYKRDGIVAMGDDSLEHIGPFCVNQYREFIESCGHRVKRISGPGPISEREFCSARITYSEKWAKWVSVPTRTERAVCALMLKRASKLQYATSYFASACLNHAFDDALYPKLSEAFLFKCRKKIDGEDSMAQHRSREAMQSLFIRLKPLPMAGAYNAAALKQ